MGGVFSKIFKRNEEQLSILEQADSVQEVHKRIFMGSAKAAYDKELLKKHRITHIVAIGYDLKCPYPDDFAYKLLNNVEDRPSYILIPHFKELFEFMDDCLLGHKKNNLLVHCHKGLSRSASVIIAYVMRKNKQSFEVCYKNIRKNRPFIMPNIGFQSQLQLFGETNYSTNMNDYKNIEQNIFFKISSMLPAMNRQITTYTKYFEQDKSDNVDDNKLFEITMYFHQVDLLARHNKLPDEDVKQLDRAIKSLRFIQTEFIKQENSIKMLDKLFRLDENGNRIVKTSSVNNNNNKDDRKEDDTKDDINEDEDKKTVENNNNNIENTDNKNDDTNETNKNDTKKENNNDTEVNTETPPETNENENNNDSEQATQENNFEQDNVEMTNE